MIELIPTDGSDLWMMSVSDQIISTAIATMILMEALAVLIFAAVALAEYIYPPEEVKKGRPK